MNSHDLDARLEQLAALGEPGRRALYRYVAAQSDAVSREQAAAGVGVAFHVAKFHLDRLVDDGLLVAEYRRPPGRGGPGAGRPTKLYRAVGELDVSVPERRYDLAGRVLVRAVATASAISAEVSSGLADGLADVARGTGRDMAQELSLEIGHRSPVSRLLEVLSSCGYEPAPTGPVIELRNCPFHRLVEEDRELVCGMNLSFVTGLLEGAGVEDASASLDPQPRGCCVRIASPPLQRIDHAVG